MFCSHSITSSARARSVGNGQPERFGRAFVQNQFKPACLNDGGISRASALQDAININRSFPMVFSQITAVRHQSARQNFRRLLECVLARQVLRSACAAQRTGNPTEPTGHQNGGKRWMQIGWRPRTLNRAAPLRAERLPTCENPSLGEMVTGMRGRRHVGQDRVGTFSPSIAVLQ